MLKALVDIEAKGDEDDEPDLDDDSVKDTDSGRWASTKEFHFVAARKSGLEDHKSLGESSDDEAFDETSISALADWRATHDLSYEQNLHVAGARLSQNMFASKSKNYRRTACLKPVSARNAGKGLSSTASAVKTRLYRD